MPIYEYQCPTCSDRFEKLTRSNATADATTAEVRCPACGAEAKRVVSAFAAIGFAGSRSAPASQSSCAPTGG